jgi:hypothetical protein
VLGISSQQLSAPGSSSIERLCSPSARGLLLTRLNSSWQSSSSRHTCSRRPACSVRPPQRHSWSRRHQRPAAPASLSSKPPGAAARQHPAHHIQPCQPPTRPMSGASSYTRSSASSPGRMKSPHRMVRRTNSSSYEALLMPWRPASSASRRLKCSPSSGVLCAGGSGGGGRASRVCELRRAHLSGRSWWLELAAAAPESRSIITQHAAAVSCPRSPAGRGRRGSTRAATAAPAARGRRSRRASRTSGPAPPWTGRAG